MSIRFFALCCISHRKRRNAQNHGMFKPKTSETAHTKNPNTCCVSYACLLFKAGGRVSSENLGHIGSIGIQCVTGGKYNHLMTLAIQTIAVVGSFSVFFNCKITPIAPTDCYGDPGSQGNRLFISLL